MPSGGGAAACTVEAQTNGSPTALFMTSRREGGWSIEHILTLRSRSRKRISRPRWSMSTPALHDGIAEF